MMNLIQAMEILNENRPNRPQSLEKKKLQEAIDTLNDYTKVIPDVYCYRCAECANYQTINGKERPYGGDTKYYCPFIHCDIDLDEFSCGMFIPKEDNNEKTD